MRQSRKSNHKSNMTPLPTINALGTTWWIEIFAELDGENTQIVFNDLRVLIAEFEDNYSRFKPESKLSELNTTHKFPNPSKEFLDIIATGLKLYRDTNGVFNPLLGEHLNATGYDTLYSFTPKDNPLITPDPTSVLHTHEDKILLSHGHLDIGGYGKGYLIDLIAKRLNEAHNLPYFLINGGGDMYATSEYGKPITIYLEHPKDAETIVASTTLFNEGFAASSTIKRRWHKDGQTYSHIIDPSSGGSSNADHGVFVKAPSAALADGWATTLILSRPEDHLDKMTEEKVRAAIYQTKTNTLHRYGEF